jgi:hypothetical protein
MPRIPIPSKVLVELILFFVLVGMLIYLLLDQHPPVGTYIAILGLLAAIVAFFEKPTTLEKAVCVFAFCILTVFEISNLYKERESLEIKEHENRIQEAAAIKSIIDGLQQSNQANQIRFNETIAGVKGTLEVANTAVLNTRPIAKLRETGIEPVIDPPIFMAGREMRWNIHYINDGNETAKSGKALASIYVGKLDDENDQRAMVIKFDKLWQTSAAKLIEVFPATPTMGTIPVTFNQDEIDALDARTQTMYLLWRFEWFDSTGHLASEGCIGAQNFHNWTVTHNCVVHNRTRYFLKK